jgi:hypothetical protein
MEDIRAAVVHYVAMLSGPDSDNACHSLWELGEVALPYLVEAFETTRSREVQLRIGEVVCQLRVAGALPLLKELLNNSDPALWKVALDGLVLLADNPLIRGDVVDTLVAAREAANTEKRSWIDEAIEQLPLSGGPA